MPPTPRVLESRQVTPAACYHGEGAVWDVRERLLRYVDMLAGDVMTFDPAAERDGRDPLTRTHVGDVAAVLRPRRSGGWVLALERGFALTSPGSWEPEPFGEPLFTDPGLRLNEGGCDAAGGFYCGSMAYDFAPGAGSLYRLAPDGSVSVVIEHVTISNGFCLSPDDRLAYYVDTPTERVDVFDVAAGGATVSGRRPFVSLPHGGGRPDGLTVDEEGGVWVAVYGGGAVHRYTPDGRLDTIVRLPTPHITSCSFGGEDLRDLYITTSQENLDVAQEPQAGALFHAVPGPRGLQPYEFAG
jgi:sugar lactone lactonase YvrE